MFDDDFREDDLVDDMFMYDQVMNDGKWFFGEDEDKKDSKDNSPKNPKQEPTGGGCLTAIIMIVALIIIIF